jgi:hypothetical protein
MSGPEETPQSRIAETAPPDATAGLDPLPPKPEQAEPALDLQAIRLLGVTASSIVDQRGETSGRLTGDDAKVFDQALDSLVKLADEVERLGQEVTTREAAARHALDAATQARQEAERLRADLEGSEDDRAAAYLAAAYLVEAHCWDLLERVIGQLPDKILADPEQPALDHDLGQLRGQLRHDIDQYLQGEPPAMARALSERLRTAETVCAAADGVPDLLGEGSFAAGVIDQTKVRLHSTLIAWKAAREGVAP